jgi:single-stranded-DNA-specific exonuclease
MKWIQREPVIKPHKSDTIVEKITKARGIKNIQSFLNPSEKELINPKLLDNISIASAMIIEAIESGKRICVSADCDSDGVMSTGIMYRYLKQFTNNLYYIYNQRSEGHGIENQLQYVQDNTDLVIILDSSSNSVRACKRLKEKGMDVIVLDHHTIDVKNPHVVLVNPQNDFYPNKHLSGAGVTFKTIQVMDELLKSGKVWDMIDLCAIGIFGDMMKIDVMENRYLIIKGMKNIRNYGIKAILDVKNIPEEDVNSQTLGFTIVPLINSASRLGKIELALELVMSDDYDECLYLVEEINKLNEKRKVLQKELTEEYSKKINTDEKVLIAIGELESKSFNGLVAQGLSKEHQRPALVMREHKGSLGGSYRTFGDFDVQSFLRGCPHINSADGHPYAGGVTLYSKNLDKFREYVNSELAVFEFEQVVEYDLEIDVSEVTEDFIIQVEKINYLTGQGFPTVLFKVKGIIYDSDGRKTMGANNNHVKIKLDDITLIKFNTTEDYALNIPDMSEIEVVGQLNLNIYVTKWGREYRTNQLLLDDFRVAK